MADLIELAPGDQPIDDDEDLDLGALVRGSLNRVRRPAPHIEYLDEIDGWPMTGSSDGAVRAVNDLLDNAGQVRTCRLDSARLACTTASL